LLVADGLGGEGVDDGDHERVDGVGQAGAVDVFRVRDREVAEKLSYVKGQGSPPWARAVGIDEHLDPELSAPA